MNDRLKQTVSILSSGIMRYKQTMKKGISKNAEMPEKNKRERTINSHNKNRKKSL
jgi:hypothetical protein